MSRKKPERRARLDQAYGVVNVDGSGILSVAYEPQNDTFEMVNAIPGTTRTVQSYERKKGTPKIVSSTPSDGVSAATAEKALYGFDRVLAIDTNTKIISGKSCAFCAALQVEGKPSLYGAPGIPFSGFCGFIFVGVSSTISAERLGWHYVLQQYLERNELSSERVAVVVDSHFSDHAQINRREAAYYEDNLLPSYFSLAYASSEVGSEHLQGTLLRECHSLSNSVYRAFSDGVILSCLPHNNQLGECESVVNLRLTPTMPGKP